MKDLIKKLESEFIDFNPYYDECNIDIDDLRELLYEIKNLKHWCLTCLEDLNENEKECNLSRCFVCDPGKKDYYKQAIDKLN